MEAGEENSDGVKKWIYFFRGYVSERRVSTHHAHLFEHGRKRRSRCELSVLIADCWLLMTRV